MKSLSHFLLFIALASCSPQALVPYAYNSQIDTDPVAVIEANDLTLYMENIERKSDLLVFDLEIVNNSDRPIQISHPELYYYAGYKKFDQVNDTVIMDIQNAYAKPEQKVNRRNAMNLRRVEKYYERKASDQKTMGILLFALGVGLVINDIVQDGNDASKAVWTEVDANRAVTRDVLTASSLLAIDIIGHETAKSEVKNEEELRYVPFEMFPEQQVAPGESMRGKLFFPASQIYKYYRFVLPVGNTDYVFDFRKRKQADKDKLRAHDLRR